MSIFTGQLDVTDTPAAIFDDAVTGYLSREITIVNRSDSTDELFIIDAADDGADVGTTGFGLAPGAGLSQEYERPGDLRVACASGGTARLQYIAERNG